MKLAEFKKAFSKRLSILVATTKFTYQIETAFRTNNWANVLSTCFYTLSQILFINVLYVNVKLIAGYSKDEMLLFMFIGQVGYYISWLFHANLLELIQDVNKGTLDTLLIKPVPSLFYITFKKIRLFSVVRDCLPPLIVLGLLGITCAHIVHLLSALPVFWLGESESILNLSQEFEYNIGKVIPFEGFGNNFKLVFTTIVPVMISAGVATSVILMKLPIFPTLIWVVIITILALIVRQWIWKFALRTYTSASS